MTIPRRRRLEPVPHEPSHRRSWRSLWRRCSCGLPAPCVDRLIPAPRLPFPPTGVPPAPVRTVRPSAQPCWFATADGTTTPQYAARPSDHAYPVGGSIRSSAAWPTGEADRDRSITSSTPRPTGEADRDVSITSTTARPTGEDDRGEADRGEASIRGKARSPNDVVRPPGQTAWPSVGTRVGTGRADEFDRSGATGGSDWPGESRLATEANAKGDAEPAGETPAGDGPWPTNTTVAGDRSWPLSDAVPDDAAWQPSADNPSGDINPRRLPPSGQQVRAPAWDAPTVLLSQVGRAGDLTPAQAYRAGRGRSW